MKFQAKAKSSRRCAYACCQNKGNKIYTDDKWRIIACSQAHAEIARKEIDKVPEDQQAMYFK